MDQQELNEAIFSESIATKTQQVEMIRSFLKQHMDNLSGQSIVHAAHLVEQIEMEMNELLEECGVNGVAIDYELPNHDNN